MLSSPPGRATESGAQSEETEQNPQSQPSGAVSGKRVTFTKVIKVITLGDKVDQASFHLFHHFLTRPKLKNTIPKHADVEQYQEALGKFLSQDCQKEGHGHY